jgi:hypothetical protein
MHSRYPDDACVSGPEGVTVGTLEGDASKTEESFS